jgi:translation elongation factor EF-4
VPIDALDEATLVADNEAGEFTLLPGSLPQEVDDSAIVRVGMQRGALGALGLPVNEERVSDWIQVDLLVGQDGLPKAVRLQE